MMDSVRSTAIKSSLRHSKLTGKNSMSILFNKACSHLKARFFRSLTFEHRARRRRWQNAPDGYDGRFAGLRLIPMVHGQARHAHQLVVAENERQAFAFP